MQRKAILFAAVIAVVFALSPVSALYVCDSTQTILKLGAVDNAHVELYNESLYSLNLCYGDIYGINYTLANPHVCTGSNTVAKLAQVTNSHLEPGNGTSFTNLACYGDLSCSLRTGACLANENLVLTLAQATNSHASFNNTLPFKLCCSSAFAITNTTSSSSGGSSGSGGQGSRVGFSSVSQGGSGAELLESDEPIFLETADKKKVFSLTALQLFGTIIFLLIILILLAILFAHKRNQPNRVK